MDHGDVRQAETIYPHGGTRLAGILRLRIDRVGAVLRRFPQRQGIRQAALSGEVYGYENRIDLRMREIRQSPFLRWQPSKQVKGSDGVSKEDKHNKLVIGVFLLTVVVCVISIGVFMYGALTKS
jgi:hypothetical protein